MTDYWCKAGMTTITCYKCGVLFGMPDHLYRKCLEEGEDKEFYCPNGHGQVFSEGTVAKLKLDLSKTEQRLAQMNERRERAEASARRKERKYARIRDRVKNGVCPCCNRTFQNLAAHMKTQHPDFGQDKQLKTLRLLYGLTQSELADEVGLSAATVSLAERGKPLGDYSQRRIDEWLETA